MQNVHPLLPVEHRISLQTYWWIATCEVSNFQLKYQTWNYPVQYSKYKKKTRWPPLLLYDRERKQDDHHCHCMTEKEIKMATIAIVWQRKKIGWPPLLLYDRERNQDGHHCLCMTEKEIKMATIAFVWQRHSNQ